MPRYVFKYWVNTGKMMPARVPRGRSVSLIPPEFLGNLVWEVSIWLRLGGQELWPLLTLVHGPVNTWQSSLSEEPFELVVEIWTNPSLVHNKEQEQMLQAGFQVKLLLTDSPAPDRTCRWFHALGVEEGERRSLKTESIPSTVVKWFFLLNTDKAGARVSGCICVQDICPTFITQYFLHRRSSGALASEEAGRIVSPGCCLTITLGMGNMSSLCLSAPWELSAGLEQWYSGDSQLEKGLPPGDLGSIWRHFWFPQLGGGGGAWGWCC